jgi:hypothetical protein
MVAQAFPEIIGQVVSGLFAGVDRALPPSRTQGLDQTFAERGTNVCAKQGGFDGLECFLIDLPTGQGPKNTGEGGAGLGQS